MPSKNQTVMKVNKSTLAVIREIGKIIKKSPPKVVEIAVDAYLTNLPTDNLLSILISSGSQPVDK